MEVLRTAKNMWGQETLLGVSLELVWIPAAAAMAFIIIHQFIRLIGRRGRRA